MTDDEGNVVSLDARRPARAGDTSHSRRAVAEKQRWLEIWREGWTQEERRRGKRSSHADRVAFAARVRVLVREVQERHGARSGRISAVVERAIGNASDPAQARARGCPERLIGRLCSTRDYRIDRFVSRDPKALRGKLVDWLWMIESLAVELGRSVHREIISAYDEARFLQPAFTEMASAGIAEEYEAIFSGLSERLQAIAATVARQHNLAAYYECCDKMHAAWFDGKIIENDTWFDRFNRFEFQDGGWVATNDGSYWDDPVARSPLGPVCELLVHAPLARIRLCYVEPHEEMRNDGFPGEWASLEVDVHLAVRPDVEDPREAGALLLHPFVAVYEAELGREARADRWWRGVPQVAIDPVEERWFKLLLDAVPPAHDQHVDRAVDLARQHSGECRLLPLTGEACQAWLSFGANMSAPDFDHYFWHAPEATDVDPRAIVSAPVGTLAGYIQFNLVMAEAAGEGADRIDRLLAADACRKVAAMRSILEVKRQGYEEWLSLAIPGEELPQEVTRETDCSPGPTRSGDVV